MIMVSNPIRDYANFVVNSLNSMDLAKWNLKLIKYYPRCLEFRGVTDYGLEQAIDDADIMYLWPMLCNISIAAKTRESTDRYEKMIRDGAEMTSLEKRHLKLMYLTRPRLTAAALDAGLEGLLEGKKSDLKLPFVGCCCNWRFSS